MIHKTPSRIINTNFWIFLTKIPKSPSLPPMLPLVKTLLKKNTQIYQLYTLTNIFMR